MAQPPFGSSEHGAKHQSGSSFNGAETMAKLQTDTEWLEKSFTGSPVCPSALLSDADAMPLEDWGIEDNSYYAPTLDLEMWDERNGLSLTDDQAGPPFDSPEVSGSWGSDDEYCQHIPLISAGWIDHRAPLQAGGHENYSEPATWGNKHSGSTRREVVRQQPDNLETFMFDHHRTLFSKPGCGSVGLGLISTTTGNEAVAFFNVDLTWQRGPRKGETRDVGKGGIFLAAERSNFRKFIQQVSPTGPRRWAAIHKELASLMNGVLFTADIDIAFKGNGEPYQRAKNLKVVE